MSLLSEASEDKKFDVRLMERHVRSGALSAEEVRKAGDRLPDDAKEVTWTSWAEVERAE